MAARYFNTGLGLENPTAALATIQKFWSDVNRSILEGMQADEVVRKALAGAQSNPIAPVLSDQWQDIAGSIPLAC